MTDTVVLPNPGLPADNPTQLSYELLKASGLTALSYGRTPLEQHLQQLLASVPVLRETRAHAGVGGTVTGSDGGSIWTAYDGPQGSAVAVFITGSGADFFRKQILEPFSRLAAPLHFGLASAGASVPADAAAILTTSQAVPLWQFSVFAHQRPADAPPVPFPTPAAPPYSLSSSVLGFAQPAAQFALAPPPAGYPESRPASPSSRNPLLMGGAVIAAVLIALVIAWALGIFGRSTSDHAAPWAASSGNHSAPDPEPDQRNASGARHGYATPPLITGPDGSASQESCPSGEPIPNASGWPSHAGRGSTMTSCQFTRNVGIAYWQFGPADEAPRRVVAPGAVPCRLGGDRCEGTDFVMDCRLRGDQDWVTCEGGRDAVVYLFGR